MKFLAFSVCGAGAVAALPVVLRLRRDWQAFEVLRAIEIRTVNTVGADVKREEKRAPDAVGPA